jgi:hypothetical protein
MARDLRYERSPMRQVIGMEGTKHCVNFKPNDGCDPTGLNELNRLRDALRRIKEQTKDFERYSLCGVLHRIASDALKPNK